MIEFGKVFPFSFVKCSAASNEALIVSPKIICLRSSNPALLSTAPSYTVENDG